MSLLPRKPTGPVDGYTPPNEPLWDPAAATLFARKLEKALRAVNTHVALGGSVLHRGYSGKLAHVYVGAYEGKRVDFIFLRPRV